MAGTVADRLAVRPFAGRSSFAIYVLFPPAGRWFPLFSCFACCIEQAHALRLDAAMFRFEALFRLSSEWRLLIVVIHMLRCCQVV